MLNAHAALNAATALCSVFNEHLLGAFIVVASRCHHCGKYTGGSVDIRVVKICRFVSVDNSSQYVEAEALVV